jgi:hypothetical protein
VPRPRARQVTQVPLPRALPAMASRQHPLGRVAPWAAGGQAQEAQDTAATDNPRSDTSSSETTAPAVVGLRRTNAAVATRSPRTSHWSSWTPSTTLTTATATRQRLPAKPGKRTQQQQQHPLEEQPPRPLARCPRLWQSRQTSSGLCWLPRSRPYHAPTAPAPAPLAATPTETEMEFAEAKGRRNRTTSVRAT